MSQCTCKGRRHSWDSQLVSVWIQWAVFLIIINKSKWWQQLPRPSRLCLLRLLRFSNKLCWALSLSSMMTLCTIWLSIRQGSALRLPRLIRRYAFGIRRSRRQVQLQVQVAKQVTVARHRVINNTLWNGSLLISNSIRQQCRGYSGQIQSSDKC